MKKLLWNTEIHSGKVIINRDDVYRQIRVALDDPELYELIKKRCDYVKTYEEVRSIVGWHLHIINQVRVVLMQNSLTDYKFTEAQFDTNQYFKIPETVKAKARKKK